MPLSGLKTKINYYGGYPLFSKGLRGWTGLKSCGSLLADSLDVGNDGVSLYGVDNTAVWGASSLLNIGGLAFVRLACDVSSGLENIVLALGDGTQQMPGISTITVTFQSYGDIVLPWEGAVIGTYSTLDANFAAYMMSLDGQRTSFNYEVSA